MTTPPELADLLAGDMVIDYRTRRRFFEKRIVRPARDKNAYVLYRFLWPGYARKLASTLDTMRARGIPAQRLLVCRDGWHDLLRYHGSWLVTGLEPGTPLDLTRMNNATAGALALSLARLHSIESDAEGPLFLYKPWHRTLQQRLMKECRRVLENSGSDPPNRAKTAEWLQSSAGVFTGARQYQLVHGDLLAKNILVRPDGAGICLIDYELMAYEIAGLELASVLTRFFSGARASHRSTFLASYFDASTEGARQAWKNFGADYLIYALFRFSFRLLRRSRRLQQLGQATDAGERLQRAIRFRARACTMVDAVLSGERDPETLLDLRY